MNRFNVSTRGLFQICQQTMFIGLIVLAGSAVVRADAPFFTVPYDANLFLTPLGGEAGAITEFGFGTSQDNAVPVFTGLPGSPMPDAEVEIGFFATGTPLNFYMISEYGSTEWAFSIDTVGTPSLVAFYDVNNLLGLGGNVVEPTSATTWALHLDDAVSYNYDDDNNDILIQIRLEPVPEPSTAMIMFFALVAGLAGRRNRR